MLSRKPLSSPLLSCGLALLSCSLSVVTAATVDSKILILARDEASASTASSGLNAYGIPYEAVLVPKEGFELPTLQSNDTGSYGGIIVMSAVSYDYDGSWQSALTDVQWDAIYQYQTDFHVRLARIDEYPSPTFGVTIASGGDGCCETGVDQLVSFSNTDDFATANVKTDAGLTTSGIWHYPATITNTTTTKEIAKFGSGGPYTSDTTAAVINDFSGREQLVWFMAWPTDWSATPNFLQHAHIHWLTRGLFLGKRKVHLSTQVDDVQLTTGLYLPNGTEFKSRTGDIEAHITWQTSINSRLPSGSDYWLEMGHNGNGDIIGAVEDSQGEEYCDPDYAVDYVSPPDTPLEFVKPLGTGEDRWQSELEEYSWTKQCAQLDDFAAWWLDEDHLNAFAHVSHTFSHLELNNATYHDASREIHFNQAWLKQMGIDQARRFSPKGLIPPAITGLHNGDAIQAWIDNGIVHVVGDNTRPVLKNSDNIYHPLVTTVESNGYAGLYIIPRYSTTIYYNCDTPACTLQEWKDTSAGSGDFDNLLKDARVTNTRYLLGLQADPYMFHQANLRQTDADTLTIGTETGKMSLVMAWVETIAQEMYRLTNWPITSLTHDATAEYFIDRMTLDACNPDLSYTYSSDGKSISSVTVMTDGNSCSVPVPVTIPSGSATASGGSVSSDTVGSEPTIIWVTMNGSPVTLSLSSAVALE